MRVLVYPSNLEVGGSQLNAIELGGAVRNFGWEVVMYGPDGTLRQTIDRLGLEFIEAPAADRHPSRAVMRHLTATVVSRKIQLVHGYESDAIQNLAYGPHLRNGIP